MNATYTALLQVFGIDGSGLWSNFTDPEAEAQFPVILGYNEPDQHEQADITPEEAAIAWIQHQEKYADRILVSPAPANANTKWMDAFMAACEPLGCRIDYLATHIYTGTPNEIMTRLKEFSERYGGRKIWLTEFALAKTHDEVNTLLYNSLFALANRKSLPN